MKDERALQLILNNNRLKAALGAVLDLASDNALDPDLYHNDEQLHVVALEQQADLDLVGALYSVL